MLVRDPKACRHYIPSFALASAGHEPIFSLHCARRCNALTYEESSCKAECALDGCAHVHSAHGEPSVHALTASSFSPCIREPSNFRGQRSNRRARSPSTCQFYMAGRDVRVEDTTRFRTFALQWRIRDVGMGSRSILTISLSCGGTIGIPFGGVRLVFLVGGWWWFKWRCRWVPPLRKLG